MIDNDEIRRLAGDMIPVRRELHRQPQLGFKETFAHAVISEHLTKLNIPFDTGFAQTGIVATIEGTKSASSTTIGFRADMDALPIQETIDRPWKSIHDGTMHACGHDGHMAILLGAAAYFQNHRNDFSGSIKLVFQPAEEGIGGARKMIEDGLFEKHRMDAIFALHNWPDLPAGVIGMCSGPIMAASNSFRFDIEGKSCHAALPHLGINAGTIAADIYLSMSRLFSSLGINEPGVVSPTIISAGEARNVIPEIASVTGTIRTLNPRTLSTITSKIESLALNTAKIYGGKINVDLNTIGIPTINDQVETAHCLTAARKAFGQDNVCEVSCAMTAEDFGFMLEKVPGTYIWLGQSVPSAPDSPHNEPLHSARYDFNDDVIQKGISLFAHIAEQKLG